MRVGLISDIHANLPALEAVLEDMPPVEDVVCVGDVVGYNAWPAACVERVRSVASVTVQGNHDRNVETPERYAHNEMAHAGLEHARSEADDDQRAWLSALPFRVDFADGDYPLVHSHPDEEHRGSYVRPRQFPEMRPYLDDYDGIVLGHTHVQHEATIDDRLIVNPGSVGQPRDDDPRAAYAVLDTETDAVELCRVEYDIERAQEFAKRVGLPERTAERLAEGR
jgi:putative phosphoesterase